MAKPGKTSRRCPSCLAAWRTGPTCPSCGYELVDKRRMPSIDELLTMAPGDRSWCDVDLAAWTRLVWEVARG